VCMRCNKRVLGNGPIHKRHCLRLVSSSATDHSPAFVVVLDQLDQLLSITHLLNVCLSYQPLRFPCLDSQIMQ
jgi:hypothetical protein